MKVTRVRWISLLLVFVMISAIVVNGSVKVYGGADTAGTGYSSEAVSDDEGALTAAGVSDAHKAADISDDPDATAVLSLPEESEVTEDTSDTANPNPLEGSGLPGNADTSDVSSPDEDADASETSSLNENGDGAEASSLPENPEAAEEESFLKETTSIDEQNSPEGSESIKDPEEEIYSGVMQLLGAAEKTESGELSLTATKGVYWFDPSVGYKEDLTDTYIYDDALLKGDSLEFNRQLATMTYELAVSSISSHREPNTPEGYAGKSRNLRAYLEDNGFENFAVNKDYTEKMTVTSMGVACAHKQIKDNGKTYTVLVIAPRSAGYEAEWGSNFMMGAEGDHEGFALGKDKVLEFARQYVSDYEISGDIKVWTAGYSRGAGVTDLVAAALLRDPNGALGDSVTLTPDNLYCYTFGTPGNADIKGDYQDEKYLYVHNTYPLYDIVTSLPPVEAGFAYYGSYTPMVPDDENAKEQMIKLLEETNPALWDVYVNGGGDPDGFHAKTIDLEALANGELKLTDDDASYIPNDQAAFLRQLLGSSLMDAVVSRENYKAVYQDPMVRFSTYFLSNINRTGDLMGEVLKSPYAIPAGASMYMYIVTEKLLNVETLSSEEKAEMVYDYLLNATELIEKLDFDSIPEESELRERFDEFKDLTKQRIVVMLEDPNTLDKMSGLMASLYSLAMRDGLRTNGADQETIDQFTSFGDSSAMSRIFSYLLFEDGSQQDHDADLREMNANMIKHAATFIGNGAGYMVPHLNEVVISWLKVQDEYYKDVVKENAAQIAGYRRVYVEQPEGVDVTGYVKDVDGNVVAVFKNGEMISRTNSWIGMTTSDRGNWLRLPVDEEYHIDFEISDDTRLSIVVSEYDTYENKEVRIETSDSKLSWKDILLRVKDRVSLILSALQPEENGAYLMNSDVPYYMDLLRRFTVTYMLEGGTLDDQSGSVVFDVDDGTHIVLPAPTRDGYTFAYWLEPKYNAGDPYTVTDDHTFTAVWNKLREETSGEEVPEEDDETPLKPDDGKKDDNGKNDNKVPANKNGNAQNKVTPVPSNSKAGSNTSVGAANANVTLSANTNTAAPGSGDRSNITIWLLIAGASAAGIIFAVIRRKITRKQTVCFFSATFPKRSRREKT